MLSQKTQNNFKKTNALKEKFSTKNENKQKNGEEFMQNQAKKQQFDKNCSAVSPQTAQQFGQQFHQTAEQFGQKFSSFTKLLSSLVKLLKI